MTQLRAALLQVSDQQLDELHAIIRKRTSPQQQVVRAQIIVLSQQGIGVRETARRLGVARTTVQSWRHRWRSSDQVKAMERLDDRPRPGAPPTYTPEQVCAIVAIACERPEDSGHPITHWTQQEIADEAVKRGIAEAVSQRAVGHFLKRSRPATASHPRLADRQARPAV